MSSSNAVPVESKIKYLEYSSSWNHSGSMLWTYPARAESSIRSTLKLETPPPKASDSHSHSGSEQSEPGQQPATQPSSSQSSHSESTPSATTNGLSTSSASHPVPPATQAGSSTSNDATSPVTIPRYVYTSKLMRNFKPSTLFWSDTETPKRPTINEPQFRAEDDSDRNVYTAEHHSIKLLLWHAERYGRILWTDYTAIQIALAALSVFNKPELRAHWVFWDWRSQTETARTIDQVYRDASHRIQFPYPWDNNYASYALKDVNILQRAAHEVLLDKDWYLGVLAPTWLDIVLYTRRLQKQERDRETRKKKKKAASKSRKRKGPQLGSRKRTKHATTAAPKHDDRTDADPADDTVPGSTPKAGKKRGREAVGSAESSTAPQATTSPDEPRPKVPLRTSARIKKLQEESGTATPPTAAPGPSTSPSPADPTLRSTSGASFRTIVATPGSQSRSRSLSVQTVVGVGKGKGKAIEVDEEVDTVGDEDSKLMPPPPAPAKARTRASSVVPQAPPLVTRARARELQRAAATPDQSVAAPPPTPLKKSTRAKSKSKIASTPYPKGKEAQIASGRGKAKKAKN